MSLLVTRPKEMWVNKKIYLLFGLFFCIKAYAWQHEVAIGYGYGQEVEQNYNNQGVVLSGKIYRFPNIDQTLIPSIDGTMMHMRASTSHHQQMTTVAIALAMRAYFANPEAHIIRPYLQASFGPTYLSTKQLGNRSQGAHFAFQTSLEAGSEFGTQTQSLDVNLRLIHICNAGIFHPNQGINLLPILSIGYMF